MPELEAKVPRPRERTFGGEGGGGGPMREARGSESDAELGVGERMRFSLPFLGSEGESLPLGFRRGLASESESDEGEGDLRRRERRCLESLWALGDRDRDLDLRR